MNARLNEMRVAGYRVPNMEDITLDQAERFLAGQPIIMTERVDVGEEEYQSALRVFREFARERGLRIYRTTRHGMSAILYAKDNNGNKVRMTLCPGRR